MKKLKESLVLVFVLVLGSINISASSHNGVKGIKLICITIMLLLSSSCSESSNIKDITVKKFDYNKAVESSLVKRNKKVNSIEKKYYILNQNYVYAKDKGNCSVFNKAKGTDSYYLIMKESNLFIYTMMKNKCEKLHSFQNVLAVSNNQAANKDTLFLNIIFDEDELKKKSGLWLVNRNVVKQLSYFKSMASEIVADTKSDTLYVLEHSESESFFRHYNKSGEKINEYRITASKPYMKFYIKDNSIYFIDVVEITADEKYDYVIDKYELNNIFENINKKYVERIVLKDQKNTFNNTQVNEKYIVFHSTSAIVCDLDYIDCIEYDSVNILDNSEFILISKENIKDNNTLLLNKFKTDEVEKLLSFDDSYISYKLNDELYIKAYTVDGNDFKLIKYKLNPR